MSSRLLQARRIVVRAPNWVGDVLMSTPTLALLRRLNPEAEIVVLARSSTAPLLEGNPRVSDVWILDDQSRSGWLDALRRLRRARFEAGLLLTNSFQSALLLRIGGVRTLRGFNRDGRGFLLAEPVEFAPEMFSTHEVVNYLRLLAELLPSGGADGVRFSDQQPGNPPLEYNMREADRARLEPILAPLGVSPETPILSITPGAAFGTAKRWAPERFAEAAVQLARPTRMVALVMGSEHEADTAEEVCQGIRAQSRGALEAHNLAGRLTLRLVAAVLERTRLHLTNDSGPMHVGAALGTPIVAVFGSTDWITTAPWTPNARIARTFTECSPCLYRHCPIDHRCMERVAVTQVVQAARELLSGAGSRLDQSVSFSPPSA